MGSTSIFGGDRQRVSSALPYNVSFSPDGARVAYAQYRDADKLVSAVLDGKILPGPMRIADWAVLGRHLGFYGMVAPRFSPDGKHFAYVGSKNPKWRENGPNLQIIVDAVGSSFVDRIVAFDWQDDDAAWAVVRRGDEYFRIEVRVPD